jgi:hypothetical protein
VLKELGKADWLRILNIPERRIPAVVILRGTRNLQSQYEKAGSFFTDVLDVGAPNGIIEHVLIGNLAGRPVGFACVYGAPMASEIVHIFGTLGTRAVIQTGNCGGLADQLSAGDLFVPIEAYCGEGAAQYYKSNGQRVTAFPAPAALESCARYGTENFQTGKFTQRLPYWRKAKPISSDGISKVSLPLIWKQRRPSQSRSILAWIALRFCTSLTIRDDGSTYF